MTKILKWTINFRHSRTSVLGCNQSSLQPHTSCMPKLAYVIKHMREVRYWTEEDRSWWKDALLTTGSKVLRVGVKESHSEALTGNKIARIGKMKNVENSDGRIIPHNGFGMHDVCLQEASYCGRKKIIPWKRCFSWQEANCSGQWRRKM